MMGDNAAGDNAAGDFAAGDFISLRMDTKSGWHAEMVSIQGFFGGKLRREWIRN